MIKRLITHKYAPIFFALIGMSLVLPAVWTGWQQDDINMRYFLLGYPGLDGKAISPFDIFAFLNGDAHRTLHLMDIGLIPWWTLENMRLSFWRPLSSISHWIDYRLWPDSGALMHVQSLLWLGAVILVAASLYRRFMGNGWAAGLAALFFAIDDAHGLPAGWLANRNALVATLFGLLALLFHDRWRREQWRTGAILGPVFFLLGLLSGEFALGVVGYLLAYEALLDSGSWRRRLLVFLPYGIVACAWLAVYTLSGYGTWGSGFYVDPMSEPWAYIKAFVTRAPLLLADQLAVPPTTIVLFMPPSVVTAMLVWAILLVAALGVALWPLIRHDRTARFWALGMVLSLPPVCATMPHSRLLLFAGLGGMGLVAGWMVGFRQKADWLPNARAWRRLGSVVLIVFVVAHGIIAPILLPLNAVSPAAAEPLIQKAACAAPVGPEIAGQDLIIVNPPIVFFGHYLSTARVVNNLDPPRHLRILAPGMVPLHLTRPDERTLVVRPEGGFLAFPFDNVFRSSAHPLRNGEKIVVTNMTAEVTEVTPDGRPLEVTFRFAVPLENRLFEWLQWKEGGYVPFRLPAQGTEELLPAQKPF